MLDAHSSALDMSGELDAFLMKSERPAVDSAWHGHVSFAHWLVSVLKPSVIVELGTHNGTSYAAFCNSVKRQGLQTKCYAVDTWEGDPHAGFYAGHIYDDLNRFNNRNFKEFSSLLRCTFDAALEHFPDGSVDLLHIDGLHTYEAVSHDFNSWFKKLSPRAVVLFHDTRVKHDGFGVHVLWEELEKRYANFNFHHSAGLGLLAVGSVVNPAVAQLCASNFRNAEALRARFEHASHVAYILGKEAGQKPPTFAGQNIALGRSASQSSFEFTDGETAGDALNGQKTGRAAFHTAFEKNPWWKVDLDSVQTFDHIAIFNRIEPDCADRAKSLSVLISNDQSTWTEIYAHAGSLFGGIDGDPLSIEGQWSARYVMIKLRDENFLHLDQVEIYRN